MLKKITLTAITGILFLFGQQTAVLAQHHGHDGHDHSHDATVKGDGKHFGEKISPDNAMDMDVFIKKMKGVDSMQVKVAGNVESVCQAKGCWMNLKASNGETMFVKFKDYGFFMPLDIAGRRVIVDGYAYREVTPVDELRHYAEDEGATKEEIEKITEPKEELKFMAHGVILLD